MDSILLEISRITPERKQALSQIARFVEEQKKAENPVNLTFICTHNSRRSHMSQIWASVAVFCYGIDGVEMYSGGTEATAFNPRAVAAMDRAGFRIQNPGGENPHYLVVYSDQSAALECFSKTYDDPFNPKQHFAAVMTCSEADKNCPLVAGASDRISIPYEDPKEADGTPEETARYDERCAQIAAEMFYVFSQVNTGK
ncbi:MAG: protein-tyrosine-phosphatase [Haliscomenobacter sp.]|nr:protein-tyrosine-phosphatase [Haliscomenobacter sp.]